MSQFARHFAIVPAVLMLMWPLAVPAQENPPPAGERIGDWTFGCQIVAEKNTVCALIQVIVDNKSRRKVLGAMLRRVTPGGQFALIVTAPLGIYLGTGIVGKIDGGKQFSFVLQTCTERGCEAAIELSDPLETAMKKGNRLIVGYRPRADEPVVKIGVSLKGVTVALKKLKAR